MALKEFITFPESYSQGNMKGLQKKIIKKQEWRGIKDQRTLCRLTQNYLERKAIQKT